MAALRFVRGLDRTFVSCIPTVAWTREPVALHSITGGNQGVEREYLRHGEVAEWFNAAVSKAVVPQGTGGSNPSLSATPDQDSSFMRGLLGLAALPGVAATENRGPA